MVADPLGTPNPAATSKVAEMATPTFDGSGSSERIVVAISTLIGMAEVPVRSESQPIPYQLQGMFVTGQKVYL
jgi:hypothetical protein